jgi:hypothetical protein
MAGKRRTQPPRPPAGPSASAKEGAAAVIRAAVKLFDRHDGNGVDKRLLAEILFHAAFETLDQVVQEDRRKILAGRVHVGAYNRIVGNKDGDDFSPSNTGPGGRNLTPANTFDLKSSEPGPEKQP